MSFHVERIGPRTWKIVQGDRFGEYPFAYVLLGRDKCAVIDTCCPSDDFAAFVDATVNRARLPYLVLLTHVHFDHIGGAGSFTRLGPGRLLGIVMCGADRKFSENRDLVSLAASHGVSLPVRAARAAGQSDPSLPVLGLRGYAVGGDWRPLLPGPRQRRRRSGRGAGGRPHAGPHARLYVRPGLRREEAVCGGHALCGGRAALCPHPPDPFTAIGVCGLGSNVTDYAASLGVMHRACGKIAKAVADGKAPAPAAVELPAATGTAGTAPGAAVQHGPNLGAQAKQFLEFIGVDVADSGAVGRLHFSPQRLLQVCDSSVERAAELYFSKGDMVAELAPKDGSSSAAGRAGSASSDGDASAALREALEAASAPAPPAPDAVRVSCGHIDTALSAAKVVEAAGVFAGILAGERQPTTMVDSDTAEYNTGDFAFLLAHPVPKQHPQFPPTT